MEEIVELREFWRGNVGTLAAMVAVERFVRNVDLAAPVENLCYGGDIFVDVAFWEGNAIPEFSFVKFSPKMESDVLLEE